MRRLTLTIASVAILALLASPSFGDATGPAPAASPYADPSCPKLAEVTAILDKNHEAYVVLDTTSLLNVGTTGESKILVTTVGKAVALGYEMGGCMVGPIGIAVVAPKVNA